MDVDNANADNPTDWGTPAPEVAVVEGEVEQVWESVRRFAAKVAVDPSYLSLEAYAALTVLKSEDFSDVGQAGTLAGVIHELRELDQFLDLVDTRGVKSIRRLIQNRQFRFPE